MIQLYTFGTPNGLKASIMLEETGLDYETNVINILEDEQYTAEFLAINPNGKIPAIVDADGPDGKPISVFESGAILIYLAEKSGKLLPEDPRKRMAVIEWLMFQMGGVGPMFSQTNHFRRFAKQEVPYAIERYTTEARRLYGVMDKRLAAVEFLAGDYSIADVATFPWCVRHDWQGVELSEFPNLKRWYEAIAGRPAVARGMAVPSS
jgi:GST-like protein